MNVGDVYYRKIDNCECKIRGFFYLHYDRTMSTVADSYKLLRNSVIRNNLVTENIHVLFHNDTFDTVENLFTNLYMTKVEYDKLQEFNNKKDSSIEVNNLKLQLLRDVSILPIKDKLYWTKQIENCSDVKIAQSLVEGLKKQLVINSEVEQESYEGQYTEEPYWNDNDFVPNPGEKPKRFKLW